MNGDLDREDGDVQPNPFEGVFDGHVVPNPAAVNVDAVMLPDSQKQNPIIAAATPEERFATFDTNKKNILIWGTTQSGKTTYLATLYREFQAHPKVRGKLRLTPGSELANQWLEQIYTVLFFYGVFPTATLPQNVSYPLFKLSDVQTGSELMDLIFIDGPGEMFTDPDGFARKYDAPNPLDYMRTCDGMIMLIDPTLPVKGELNVELEALHNNLLRLLVKPDKSRIPFISKPVAFCLTKCDEPAHREAIRQPVEQFVRRKFHPLMLDTADTLCSRSKWFASSALGFDTNSANAPTNIYTRWDGGLGVRVTEDIRPINVIEPLLWVLDELRLIQSPL